jgi:hypothetical protein
MRLVGSKCALDRREITKRNLARLLGDLAARPSTISDEDREAVAAGSIPNWISEYSRDWSAVARVKLTIGRYDSIFGATSRVLEGFPNIRLEYDVGTDEARRLRACLARRVSVEIDFSLIHQLALLVRLRSSSDDAEKEE